MELDAITITVLLLGCVAALYPAATYGFRFIIAGRDGIDYVRACGHELLADLLTLAFAPFVLTFGALDVLFNLFWGSVMFRELPREWLFTSRVERHYRTCAYAGPPDAPTYVHADTQRQCEAVYWADWLNEIDPRHVTMHKG